LYLSPVLQQKSTYGLEQKKMKYEQNIKPIASPQTRELFLAAQADLEIINADIGVSTPASELCEQINELVGDQKVQDAITNTKAFASLQHMFESEELSAIETPKSTRSIEGSLATLSIDGGKQTSSLNRPIDFTPYINLCSKCSQQIDEDNNSSSSNVGGHIGVVPYDVKNDLLKRIIVPLAAVVIVSASIFVLKPAFALKFFKSGWAFFMREWKSLVDSVKFIKFDDRIFKVGTQY